MVGVLGILLPRWAFWALHYPYIKYDLDISQQSFVHIGTLDIPKETIKKLQTTTIRLKEVYPKSSVIYLLYDFNSELQLGGFNSIRCCIIDLL